MMIKDQILSRLLDGVPFADIARQVGCSREYVGQVNGSLVGSRNGRDVQRSRTLATKPSKFLSVRAPDCLKLVMDLARLRGLPTSLVPANGNRGIRYAFSTQRVYINGWICWIHLTTHLVYTDSSHTRGYYRITVHNEQVADFRLVMTPLGTFVLPAALAGIGFIYIPEDSARPTHSNFPPRVNWWDYHEAWGPLKSKK